MNFKKTLSSISKLKLIPKSSYNRLYSNHFQNNIVNFPKSSTSISSRNFATYKTSTGLVGLPADPDSLDTVYKLSQEVLESVKVFTNRLNNDYVALF